jgi:ribonuclease HI
MAKYEKLKIVCDASCRIPKANVPGRIGKGKSAAGVIFLDDKDIIIEATGSYLGEMTPPQAEYNALIKALDGASQFCRKNLEIWLDSELVVKHLTGEYALKSENIKPLYDQVKALEKRFVGKVEYYHHPRTAKLAKEADKLANQELNKKLL